MPPKGKKPLSQEEIKLLTQWVQTGGHFKQATQTQAVSQWSVLPILQLRCTVCHGTDLRGIGPVPAIAGRAPSYMARQLYDLKRGNRNGSWSDLMDSAVTNLTVEDIVDIVAYTASLEP